MARRYHELREMEFAVSAIKQPAAADDPIGAQRNQMFAIRFFIVIHDGWW
jgi:hypothetical protein